MVHWIVCDDESADALTGKFKRGAAEIREENMVDLALEQPHGSLLIYPSTSPDRVLLARIRPASAKSDAVINTSKPLPVQSYRTGLGFRPPELETPRSWWRRHIA
ncbi:MAG TPA: hypothetical protein VHR84_09965 [Terriglobales bacterium]|jgi:hypothetical protein|nr:hypothetical protein [Terriglobales bacterium]